MSTEYSDLVFWVDEELYSVAEVVAEQYFQDTGATLNLEQLSIAEIRLALELEKPDLFIGSHEWVDSLAGSGVVTQVDEESLSNFQASSVEAFSYGGIPFGVPYSIESLALVCNSRLMPSQPDSFNSLVDKNYRVVLSPGSDPYLLFTLQSSFAILPLGLDAYGDWESRPGFDQPNAIEFGSWLRGNRESFLELDYQAGIDLLVSGETPCLLTGPWALSTIRESAAFELVIYSVPSPGPQQANSFSSVKGLFVASSAHTESARVIQDYFVSEEMQRLIHLETGKIPVELGAISKLEDPSIAGFARAAKNSIGLPESEKMSDIWVPWGTALRELVFGTREVMSVWNQLLLETAGN